MNLEDILSESKPKPNGIIGIYYLIHEERVVYVGQTVRGMSRIIEHITDGKLFDYYSFFPCNTGDLDRLEAIEVVKHEPHLNKALYGSYSYMRIRNYIRLCGFNVNISDIKRIVGKNMSNMDFCTLKQCLLFLEDSK